jgi:hypothetical protein
LYRPSYGARLVVISLLRPKQKRTVEKKTVGTLTSLLYFSRCYELGENSLGRLGYVFHPQGPVLECHLGWQTPLSLHACQRCIPAQCSDGHRPGKCRPIFRPQRSRHAPDRLKKWGDKGIPKLGSMRWHACRLHYRSSRRVRRRVPE